MQLSRSTRGRPISTWAIGVAGVVFGIVLRNDDPEALVVILLGSWLVAAALIHWVAPSSSPASNKQRRIAISFSGSLGRYELRSRGDGRRVEVRTGGMVVAELVATDIGDEMVVDFGFADEPDVDDFGTAIGVAMEMVATADMDLAPERVLVAGRWRRPLRVTDERIDRAGSGATEDSSGAFQPGFARQGPKQPLTQRTHPTAQY